MYSPQTGILESLAQPGWSLGHIKLADDAVSITVLPHTLDHLYHGGELPLDLQFFEKLVWQIFNCKYWQGLIWFINRSSKLKQKNVLTIRGISAKGVFNNIQEN